MVPLTDNISNKCLKYYCLFVQQSHVITICLMYIRSFFSIEFVQRKTYFPQSSKNVTLLTFSVLFLNDTVLWSWGSKALSHSLSICWTHSNEIKSLLNCFFTTQLQPLAKGSSITTPKADAITNSKWPYFFLFIIIVIIILNVISAYQVFNWTSSVKLHKKFNNKITNLNIGIVGK